MAELQFKYLDGIYCSHLGHGGNMQCITQAADAGCDYCDDGTRKLGNATMIIGDGSCIHACEEWNIKGVKASAYEVIENIDPYNPRTPQYILKIHNKEYLCDWIKVDGVNADVLFGRSEV